MKRNPTQRNRLKARMEQEQQLGRHTPPRTPKRKAFVESDSETEEEEEDDDEDEDDNEEDQRHTGREAADEQELDLSSFRPPGFPQTFSPSMEKSLTRMEEELLSLAPAIDLRRLPGDRRLDDPNGFVKFWLD